MNKPEAAKIVSILSAAYPQAQVKPETPMAYYLALSDLTYAEAERAVAVLMRTSKFLPTPAEIREVISTAATDFLPWEDAWSELMATVRKHGWILFANGHETYREKIGWPGWSTPEVKATVEMIGYRNVCMSEEDDLNTLRAQFRNSYNDICKRKQTAVQVGDAALPRGTAKDDALGETNLRVLGQKAGAA